MTKSDETIILANLDRLLQLIKNCEKDGKFTVSLKYKEYYNSIREESNIKSIIKGTIHEIKKTN